jgi:hypothetical protein
VADENELDRLAGLRPGPGWHDEDAPRISLDFDGNDADAAYTELARLRAVGDPERDARREAYADRERRKAARALDRFMELHVDDIDVSTGDRARVVAGEHFVEAVGDYVLSKIKSHWQELIDRYDQAFRDHVEQGLQQKSHYGVPERRCCGTPAMAQVPHDELCDRTQQNADSVRLPVFDRNGCPVPQNVPPADAGTA